MSFGEATLSELLDEYKGLLSESENTLGAKILHLSPPGTEIVRDRLGGTKKIEKVSEPEEINGGSVVFSPSEEMLKRVGIQERIDALMTLASSNLPETFDRLNSRFIIDTDYRRSQEFKIKEVRGVGQVNNEYVYLAIGLVVM